MFAAQFSREFEFRPVAENHPRSFTTGVSRREKENSMARAVFHWRQFSLSRRRRNQLNTRSVEHGTSLALFRSCFLVPRWKIMRRALGLAN
jgi:hypothetical protein